MSIAATPAQETTNPLHLALTPEPNPEPQPEPNPEASPGHTEPIPLALLEDLLDPALTPIQICHTHDLTLAQLRQLTESRPYRDAMEDLQAVNASRRAAIHDQLHTQALASARDLLEDTARCEEQNRTRTTAEPRPFQSPKDAAAHRQHLAAASRHHAANARLLETRRKTINTILKQCADPSPPIPPRQAPKRTFPQPSSSGTLGLSRGRERT